MLVRSLTRHLHRSVALGRAFCSEASNQGAPEVVFDVSRPDGVALVGLNRPAAKNAMSMNLMKCIEETIDALDENKAVRCVVLHSLVPKIFCAGADLKERKGMPESDIGTFVAGARKLIQELHLLPMPTIAALDGHALGGGLEIALACDLRFAADNAKLGLVETKLAIIPGAGGTQRLPRLIGIPRAKELIFTGRILSAAEAANYGVVNETVAQNAAGNAAFLRAMAVAGEIAANGPVAVRMAKSAINLGVENNLTAALEVEEFCYNQVIPTKDRVEALTAFQEKRKPQFTGE